MWKKWVRNIHLWLGLTSGLIVFIVAITGCAIVFEKEINTALGTGIYQKVKKRNSEPALPSQVFRVADSAFSRLSLLNMYYTVYPDDNNVSVLWVRDTSRKYHSLLQDPYTTQVAGEYDYESSFFTIMTFIHVSLALGEVGTTLIRYATLIFVVLMVTGLILWKPASKKGYKQRFTIKWGASFKRLNYDLHNVLGFYMTWIAVFIALTGLVWSFEWFSNSVVWVANCGKKVALARQQQPLSAQPGFGDSTLSRYAAIDVAFLEIRKREPNARALTIYKPMNDAAAIRITVETGEGSNYARSDEYFFDQYSSRLLAHQPFSGLSNGEKLLRMNYYIHVGSIAGITGKVLAFLASLIAASLPVTGFMVWRGRKKKVRKRAAG